MTSQFKENRSRPRLIRVVLSLLIIFFGIGGFLTLKNMKQKPQQQVRVEKPIKVEIAKVKPRDVPIVIYSTGELRPQRLVEISAEVSGRIVSVHKKMELGLVITKGEVLLSIDESDYLADYTMNKNRLAILMRDKDLADLEFNRVKNLYVNKKVGTESGVEAAERNAISAAERLVQVEQAMIRAKNSLNRCRVVAPFTGRVDGKFVEVGQYVVPGKVLLSMADDSVLELTAAIDSREAFNLLRFLPDQHNMSPLQWFSPLKSVPVKLRWTEAPTRVTQAVLDRVVSFDTTTRSVELLIRLEGGANLRESFPLVAGMFCSVEIPGKTLTGVFSLPRWSVTFDKKVYLVKDDRLVTVVVETAGSSGEEIYISSGLSEGDRVITTRLINPLEQSLVEVVGAWEGEKQ